jgi:hypothetical protein
MHIRTIPGSEGAFKTKLKKEEPLITGTLPFILKPMYYMQLKYHDRYGDLLCSQDKCNRKFTWT